MEGPSGDGMTCNDCGLTPSDFDFYSHDEREPMQLIVSIDICAVSSAEPDELSDAEALASTLISRAASKILADGIPDPDGLPIAIMHHGQKFGEMMVCDAVNWDRIVAAGERMMEEFKG